MKYLEKDVETESGVIGNACAAAELKVRLYAPGTNPSSEFTQPGSIVINVFVNKECLNAAKNSIGSTVYMIPDVTQLQSYPALMAELVGMLITDPASPMYGATLKDTAD
jgi:hypothetical protein